MKVGSRHNFHVVDGIADLIVNFWRARQNMTMQTLVRRVLKMAAIALVIYAMIFLLYPTQYRGWILWLGEKERGLAKATSIVCVGFNVMLLTLVRNAWYHKHRGLAIGGGALTVLIMTVVLGSAWNFYAATSSRAVNVSEIATTGAATSVQEAQAKLDAFDKQAAIDASTYAQKIASADPRYVTATGRMIKMAADAKQAAAQERAQLKAELDAARSSNVATQTDAFDPRPIDATMAKWFGLDRTFMGSINDLIRALCLELLAIFGLALGTSVAISNAAAIPATSEAPVMQSEEPILNPRLPDLRDEPFIASKAAEDNRRATAARKGWATRRAQEDEAAGPKGKDDQRVAKEKADGGTLDDHTPAPEEAIFGSEQETMAGDSTAAVDVEGRESDLGQTGDGSFQERDEVIISEPDEVAA